MTVCFITAVGIARVVPNNNCLQRLRPMNCARTRHLPDKNPHKSTNIRLQIILVRDKKERRRNKGSMVCSHRIFPCLNFNETVCLQ